MIDQLQITQALRPSADYCIDGEITESRISTCIRYVVSVDDQGAAVFGDPGDAVTWDQFDAKRSELQAKYDSTQYQRDRQAEYPSVDELIVALWEGVVEERMASVTALEANRQAVKTKYPKP